VLPARYEIRKLTTEHMDWIAAICVHSNLYCSPVWSVLYPDNKPERLYAGLRAADYLMRHQVESGMSFGVFDKEYKFKRPESAATGGRLYWDETHTDITGDELLAQMDFPLVTIAMAYDGINPLDMARLAPLMALLPAFGSVYHGLEAGDPRDKAAWEPTGPNQVLMRNATASRQDYEGQGLMAKLARFLMREAAAKGYRLINIEALHDAVARVWLNPPPPFRGELIASLDPTKYEEEDEEGEMVKPFGPVTQVFSKIVVHLK